MALYITAYAFIAIATMIATYDGNSSFPHRNELIASAISGALWPLLITVRIIAKLIK